MAVGAMPQALSKETLNLIDRYQGKQHQMERNVPQIGIIEFGMVYQEERTPSALCLEFFSSSINTLLLIYFLAVGIYILRAIFMTVNKPF